jgi:hypothetical protein
LTADASVEVSLQKPRNNARDTAFRTLHLSIGVLDGRHLGLIAFINVSRNPRFAFDHTVNAVQLIACGMASASPWPD